MPGGRPVKSPIRQNIVEILSYLGKGYGYEIHKIYQSIFPSCTREVIYYNLRKGVSLGEFEIEEIKQERGEYSWGTVVEKKYYRLGKKASPKGDERVNKYFESRKVR